MRKCPVVWLLLGASVYAQDASESVAPGVVLAEENPAGSIAGANFPVENISGESAPVVVAAREATQTLRAKRDLKIGFVNFRRIMLEIPQFTDMRSTLDNEFRTDNERLLDARARLAEMESELGRMARDDAYIAFEKQVIAKRREVARQEAAFRDAHSVRRNEEMAKLQTVVADEIVRLAKEEGFDIILNDIGVVYVGEDADLTGAVILRLQTRNR